MTEKSGHEKSEKIEGSKESKFVSSFRKNPWIVSTVVVGILALVLLIVLMSDGGVSASKAGRNVVDFAASQGIDATVSSVEESGSLYLVNLEIQGQEAQVFVTKDGGYLIQNPIPLTGLSVDSSPTPEINSVDVPKSDKPVVDLFVMSFCPYGTQAEKGILPVVSLLKDKIDFKVRWVSYIMHGKEEIDENTVQYCIQKEQSSKYLSYLQCFLGTSEGSVEESVACRKEAGINEATLKSCISSTDKQFKITELYNDKSSWMSGYYPQYNIDKDLNNQYGVQGSPTLVINGVQAESGRSPQALLSAICSSFTNVPTECNQALSSSNPSPGFGYGSSGADSSAAACGV